MISRLLPVVFACTLAVLLATGCSSSSSDASGSYHYTFQESNDTPQDLSATLFEALRTDDQELWERYCVTAEELRAHQEKRGRRQIDEERMQQTVETIRGNFTDLRDELRHEEGVHGPERIRVLRAYAPYYSPGDSLQSTNAVDFTYQGHYLGAVRFREMILTDRGWVLAEVARYQDDVQSLVPLGLMRR
ncbi:MAG: hypothetical protein GVY15_08855 [Bacteroidetes bacterium]|jgi:hypothetical protein|nr:hypothetical protein [Bacteroidota bacterium]